jgi:hypothetical protein
MAELARRDFLKLVGAGAGAAAAAGCSDPVEKLVPYVIQPESITPGISVDYASTCQECTAACGLHVKTREGRPIKLEGNPDHPVNQGALCGRGQASIQRTYHPDRFEGPMAREGDGLSPTTWEQGIETLVGAIQKSGGSKVRVLGGSRGPTLDGLIDQWIGAIGGDARNQRVTPTTFGDDALRKASGAVFGLFGALIVADRIHKPALTRNARNLTMQIGMLIGINLVIGFSVPGIDNAAHIGGLLAGMALGFLLVPRGARLGSFWSRPKSASEPQSPTQQQPADPAERSRALRVGGVAGLIAVIVLVIAASPISWAATDFFGFSGQPVVAAEPIGDAVGVASRTSSVVAGEFDVGGVARDR